MTRLQAIWWLSVSLAVAVSGILLAMALSRRFRERALRVTFMLTFMICTLPVWLLTVVVDPWRCCLAGAASRGASLCDRVRGRVLAWCVALMWNLALRVCFWIKVDSTGLDSFQDLVGRGGRPVLVLANHVSYIDTVLVTTMLPWRLLADTKTLMSTQLLQLPILGRIAAAAGHMPVPFKTMNPGDMSVDKQQMAEVIGDVDAHIERGGHLAVFPEGGLNRDNWHVLQSFRKGGFEVAIRHDMEVWGWLVAGAAECWPADDKMGGTPCRVTMQAVMLCASAKETAQELTGPGAELREQAEALAKHAQETMQRSLDDLVAEAAEPHAARPFEVTAAARAAAGRAARSK